MKKSISPDLVKARIDELQSDVDQVKSELNTLKETKQGNFQAEDIQKIDEFTRKLLTFKAGQAELLQLLQD